MRSIGIIWMAHSPYGRGGGRTWWRPHGGGIRHLVSPAGVLSQEWQFLPWSPALVPHVCGRVSMRFSGVLALAWLLAVASAGWEPLYLDQAIINRVNDHILVTAPSTALDGVAVGTSPANNASQCASACEQTSRCSWFNYCKVRSRKAQRRYVCQRQCQCPPLSPSPLPPPSPPPASKSLSSVPAFCVLASEFLQRHCTGFSKLSMYPAEQQLHAGAASD